MTAAGTAVVIPARWGSTRFPGKPLARIRGRSVIERTWRIARAGDRAGEVIVATDDARIAEHVEGFGGRVAMTRADCANGTERVYEALRVLGLAPRVAVNLQGDAALTPPWVVDAVVERMEEDAGVGIATPALRLTWAGYEEARDAQRAGAVGGTTLTFDAAGRALYFSKALIPRVRRVGSGACPVFRHVGLYGFTTEALATYLSLEPGPLEEAEQLEQLRALEHGMTVHVVEVDYRGRTHCSIDNPADVAAAERIIDREGELVP